MREQSMSECNGNCWFLNASSITTTHNFHYSPDNKPLIYYYHSIAICKRNIHYGPDFLFMTLKLLLNHKC